MYCLIASRVLICRQKVVHILLLLLILPHGRPWLSRVLDSLKLLRRHSCHLLPLQCCHIGRNDLLMLHVMSLLEGIVIHCCIIESPGLTHSTRLWLLWLSGIMSIRLFSVSNRRNVFPHFWTLPRLLILIAHLRWSNFVVYSLFWLSTFKKLLRLHLEFAYVA